MASVDLNLTALLITSIILLILVFIFNLYLLIHFYLHKSFVKHKNDDLECKRTQICSNSLSDSIKLLLLRFVKRETLISIRNFIQSFQFKMDSEQEQQRLLFDQSIEPSPPPFDPLKPAIPISYPLKTLEELESRSYFKSFHYPFNIASTPLPTYSSSAPSRPRILVCHDMAGGYGDDKWVQGGTNEGAYAIWHWYLIDIFVYFSHSLVAIPPPCWINTAHKHGVKVLGTFITEWDEGRAICNTLLLTKESAEMYAERLTELAVALGFDGWLINMEVELDAGQIPNLKVFVNHLTQTMHSSMPGSLVIWYDSVTVDGNLSWQNQLNDKNKPFFDLSDGIFVNYTWQEDYPKLSAAVAGDRKFDVYMGIDVWGRNTYGGGQWTTNVALDVLKKDDVSAAIFAPAWVYESKQPPDFQTAQNRWWGLVGKSWRILNYYPKLLPFYSNFDQGHGYHISVDGQQISNGPWNNISCQSFQPVIDNSVGSSPDTIQVMVNFKDASFSGGGNLTFKGTLKDDAYYTTGIFRGELPLDDVPIHFTYSVKSDGSSLLGLSLEFLSDDNKKTSILLAYDCMNELASKFDKVAITRQLNARDAQVGEGWILQESSISMKGYTLTQIHIVCYKSKLELNNMKLKQARKLGGNNLAQAGSSEFFASLGHITIKTPDQNSDFPPSTSWVVEGQNVSWTSGSSGTNALSIKIVWNLKEGDSSRFPTYNIYVIKQGHKVLEHQDDPISKAKEEYIAVAKVRAVYISDLVVPPGILDLKFIIQVCGPDGDCQKLDSCPALLVDVKGK